MKESRSGKWAYSLDEESYEGVYDTKEEAALEGLVSFDKCWVAQIEEPSSPESYWELDHDLERWFNNVWESEDYQGDWAENSFSPTMAQKEELEKEILNVATSWIIRHKLYPTHFNIDDRTIECVTKERYLKEV